MKIKKDKQFFSVRLTEDESGQIINFNKNKFKKDREWSLSKFCRLAWQEYISRHKGE